MMTANAINMSAHSERVTHVPFGCFSDAVVTVSERLSDVFLTVAVSACTCRAVSAFVALWLFLWVTLWAYSFAPLLSSGIVIHRLSHVSIRSLTFVVRLVVSLRLV